MFAKRFLYIVTVLVLLAARVPAAKVTGELKVWHKVTLTFDGPATGETATPNPFMDYWLEVKFTGPSKQEYRVPGYYAADGNAANTGADSGNQWRVHFSPDEAGTWKYQVFFRTGETIAIAGHFQKGEPVEGVDGQTGTFTVEPTDKSGRDFRSKGRLEYVGKHYLRFAGTKEYFLKCGSDAPETFLAYADFDGTVAMKENVPLKTWQPHVKDWHEGDPTWAGGKGKGIIGAINYLADKGANAVSFLTYNAGGDGDNVWPFRQRNEKLRYDCSKLDQWQIVFDHAQQQGVYLHFKMQEQENDDNSFNGQTKDIPESLDGGEVGPERKLYYRELIARFGYELALNWNLGEENTQTPEQQREMMCSLHSMDPYDHLIVIHSFPNNQDKVYPNLLGDQSLLTGASLQNDWTETHRRTLQWVRASTEAGKPWVVANDEQGPAKWGAVPDTGYKGFDPTTTGYDMHDIRKRVLWGNLMSGGAGVEYYFGYQLPENDLLCEDYRSREKSWDYGRIALAFFQDNRIPFWEMESKDDLTWQENDYCFVKDGEIYLIYQKQGGLLNLDLQGGATYTAGYFNPRTGEGSTDLLDKQFMKLDIKNQTYYRTFEAPDAEDWLLVIRTNGGKVSQSEKAPKDSAL